MCEVPIWISAGGKDMSIAVLGKRHEKLGGVAGSENGQ
jgi:hypothetical protein